MSTSVTSPTLYFGYGSNIWRNQMERRCPESKFIGVGLLKDWRWFLNERGVANIANSEGNEVYGFIYELNARDEATLDRFEGAPDIYQKVYDVPVKVTVRSGKGPIDEGEIVNTMVYVDHEKVKDGKIREEYIARLHFAMEDGIKEGIPKEYFDKYFSPFVPSQV
ncbi:hypothetical protein GYMLUDRAFT_44591 [Collybiopsis luxurians FD-317 M1]|uniref:gamma-glutamylcyclotransferase n=1 Tax=Collybiopsis luxurians FD-317 M1 TaxID=944289 RepID=A0A0D0CUT3_9AGAR|nr:hypothetical protein GYMLUDRAFT_44591 [Collybiopsis luxurians FD-317 M1]